MTKEAQSQFGGPRQFSGAGSQLSRKLPNGYLSKGYFDEKGNVLPEVIQHWPREIAQTLKEGRLTSTQLRRFYNKAKAIEQKFKSGQPFDRLKEEIMTLKPLAAAAVGKETAPEVFNEFMERNVNLAIQKPEAFTRGFIIHLQSIVAYTKYLEEKAKKGGKL